MGSELIGMHLGNKKKKKVAGLRYSIKNYVKEKYSFAREIAFRDLRESENWKDMPKGSELEGVKKIRVARKKHGMITRFIAGNILYHGFVQIMQIDVIVTTFCSLNCKNCSEWIPYLKEKKTFSLESLKQNIDALFRNVDFVQRINVIGGEAMLHPELPDLIEHLLKYRGKVGYLLFITNGTLLPNEDLLSTISKGRDWIRIVIDSYPPKKSAGNAKEVERAFREKGLNAVINMDLQWYDVGTFGSRYATNENDIRETFGTCPFRHCTALYDGKLYRCGRSWGVEVNTGDAEDADAVIDLKGIRSKAEMYRKLIRFFGVDYMKACAYCKKDCTKRQVPVGEQMK